MGFEADFFVLASSDASREGGCKAVAGVSLLLSGAKQQGWGCTHCYGGVKEPLVWP